MKVRLVLRKFHAGAEIKNRPRAGIGAGPSHYSEWREGHL